MKLLCIHTAYQRKVLAKTVNPKKFNKPCMSLNDGSKEVENGKSWTLEIKPNTFSPQ